MNFCSHCAQPVSKLIPPLDNRERYVCGACGAIHYENPRLVVGTLPVWRDQVLLCRRAIEPRYGYWTLPAGFMENGESVADGCIRETIEEAGAQIKLSGLYTMIDVPQIHQVHVFYRAELLALEFDPGTESLEVALFDEASIPWSEIAFHTVAQTLRHYFADRGTGTFPVHTGTLSLERRP